MSGRFLFLCSLLSTNAFANEQRCTIQYEVLTPTAIVTGDVSRCTGKTFFISRIAQTASLKFSVDRVTKQEALDEYLLTLPEYSLKSEKDAKGNYIIKAESE